VYKSEYIKWIRQLLAFKPADRPSASEMLKTVLAFASCNELTIIPPIMDIDLIEEPKLEEEPLDLTSIGKSIKLIRNLIISVSDDIDSKMTCDGIDEYAIQIVENIIAKLVNCHYITSDNYQYVVVICVIIVDTLHFDGYTSIGECCKYTDCIIDDDEKIAHHISYLLNVHGKLFF